MVISSSFLKLKGLDRCMNLLLPDTEMGGGHRMLIIKLKARYSPLSLGT